MKVRLPACLLFVAATVFAQVPSSLPPAISASVRLENWALLRSAASSVLGWTVSIPANGFRDLTFSEAAAKADALGLAAVVGSSAQKVSHEIPKNLDYKLAPGELQAVRDRFRALNLRMQVYATPTIPADEAAARKLFEFAKGLGVETLVSSADPASLDLIERLADELAVNVALTNGAGGLQGRGKRLGIHADTGHWVDRGLAQGKDRLMVLNLRDPKGAPELLRALYRLELKPLFLTVDATGTGEPFADFSRSLEAFEKALHPVMTDRIHEIARTAAIRSPDRLPAAERQKVEAALPRQAVVKPRKPRKLLVLDLNVSYGGH